MWPTSYFPSIPAAGTSSVSANAVTLIRAMLLALQNAMYDLDDQIHTTSRDSVREAIAQATEFLIASAAETEDGAPVPIGEK